MLQFLNKIKKQIENLEMKKLFSVENIREVKLSLRRFISTTHLYFKSELKQRISDNIHLTLFAIYLLFIFIYFLMPPFTKPAPEWTFNVVKSIFAPSGFAGFGDVTIKYIISTTTNLLVTLLSILSAMYVFTHREQKSISPSLYNETKKNGLMVMAIIILVFTMITGHTLISNIESIMQQEDYANFHPLHGTKVLVFKFAIWAFGIGIAIIFVIELIKYLFSSMNTDKMLRSSIRQVSEYIDVLTSFYRTKRFDVLLNERYKSMHHNIESIFQYLKFIADNNMNKDFDGNIESFSRVIDKLKEPNNIFGIDNVSSYLLKRDKEQFLGIYNSLLRNTLSLTLHTYKNNHFNKGKKLTDLYFSMFLAGEGSLKQHFTLSLNEFLDSLDTSNERQFNHFLGGLRNLPVESTLIIYKNLFQKLIIKGNLGLLTTVVYDFKEHIIDGDEQAKPPLNPMYRAITAQNKINMKNNALIILLQSLVKAIEISQYGTAGFLVKYMITNFNGEDINEAYKNLRQNPSVFTSILESTEESSVKKEENEIGLVGLNKETFDYCCKKMRILLYGQQQYAIKERLWFTHEMEKSNNIDIQAEFKGCSYSNYVIKKVKSASSKYGMLFFDDKEIMKNIYQKLNIEHHYLDDASQSKNEQPQYL
ncbi:hypothetical protein LC048_02815 [Mesobacillus subterraneus]|uniref:hypothetical protein n=1 Tax=Mesobacillus subterraneus TaxID=285983 RepID=UPI001CFE40FD|nr:hypothetical protein [Mesobacillus subterraneus]WLR55949.1 hypothetical protein LC048_02815 [Mesobacillus subterraneus]